MIRDLRGTGGRPQGATFLIAGLLAGLGALALWQGFALPDKGGYAGMGSGGLPKVVGAALMALSGAHVWAGLRGLGQPAPRVSPAPVLWIVAGLLAQLLLLKPLGFTLASGLLFALTAAGLGKPLRLTLPLGLVLAFAIYGVFDQILQLHLPAGWIETLVFGG
ncbi:tripartite tricarboxylate transporter TctB family protein [Stagnihabitans tardus]|uniref:Tripartite tricarboxylate transporter TctB family protein n=1 Tax=Stagnihabitans tardus TaxID=2699202 RepID=A0AAE4YFU5_9RHOB|nr:tripartite tricarboxylate transporter TctB family protein [Stagnihabitans tardus]NBZ89140.1 tripartite tricarboxylate transporter TctB family protein [Stagnihabitans tardus]